MPDGAQDHVDFVIDEEDLEPQLTITSEDLAAVKPMHVDVLCITDADLRKIEEQFLKISEKDLPPILQIDPKDLPPILKLSMADLPADLNYMTTECYHGTSRESAEKIRREGFRVGPRAACGAGIYFSVGGMSIARGYVKGTPCIVRARVQWGRVCYRDDPKLPASLRSGSGDAHTKRLLQKGYSSTLDSSKFSRSKPVAGVVLATIGSYVRPPRIEVMELIDPRTLTR